MGRLIFAVSVVWLMLLGNEVRHSDLTFWQAAASLAAPAFVVLMATAAWLVLRAVAALWRASRRVNVETVARAAGALTGAVQTRAGGVASAFRSGRSSRTSGNSSDKPL